MSRDQISALQGGDEGAWKEFFETHWKIIFAAARKAGFDDNEAPIVVQGVMTLAAQKIAHFDMARGPINSWLLTLTRWYIAEHQRRRGNA